jgi:hypothetical protein
MFVLLEKQLYIRSLVVFLLRVCVIRNHKDEIASYIRQYEIHARKSKGYQLLKETRCLPEQTGASCTNLLGLPDKTLARLHALSPLGPTAVVQASLLCRKPSFGQRSIDNRRRDSCAAGVYDWLGRVDTFRLEDCLEFRGREEGLVFRVEEVRDWDRGRVWNVS